MGRSFIHTSTYSNTHFLLNPVAHTCTDRHGHA